MRTIEVRASQDDSQNISGEVLVYFPRALTREGIMLMEQEESDRLRFAEIRKKFSPNLK